MTTEKTIRQTRFLQAGSELPEPIYGCKDEDCAAEHSYPADMLRWFSGFKAETWEFEPGWYCTEEHVPTIREEIRWDRDDPDAEEFDADILFGTTLAEEMARR